MIGQPMQNITNSMMTVAEGTSVLLETANMKVKAFLLAPLARIDVTKGVKYLASPSSSQRWVQKVMKLLT